MIPWVVLKAALTELEAPEDLIPKLQEHLWFIGVDGIPMPAVTKPAPPIQDEDTADHG